MQGNPAYTVANSIDPEINPIQPTQFELSSASEALRALAAENTLLKRKLFSNEDLIHTLLNPRSGLLTAANGLIDRTDDLISRAVDSLGEGGASSISPHDLLCEFKAWLSIRKSISSKSLSAPQVARGSTADHVSERVHVESETSQHSHSQPDVMCGKNSDERSRFEAWCASRGANVTMWNPASPGQGYVHSRARDEWNGWLAHANQTEISQQSLDSLANVLGLSHQGASQVLIDLVIATMTELSGESMVQMLETNKSLKQQLSSALDKCVVEDRPAAYEFVSPIGDKPLTRNQPSGPDSSSWHPLYRLKSGGKNV